MVELYETVISYVRADCDVFWNEPIEKGLLSTYVVASFERNKIFALFHI
jgi:hypothetical protein